MHIEANRNIRVQIWLFDIVKHLRMLMKSFWTRQAQMKMSMVPVTPSKMDQVWRLLRPFHWIGLCAMELNKDGLLKPMAGGKFALRFILTLMFVSIVCNSGFVFVYLTNPEGTLTTIYNSLINISNSTTDRVASYVAMGLFQFSYVAFFIEAFRLSRKLPDFWQSLMLDELLDCKEFQRTAGIVNRWILW